MKEWKKTRKEVSWLDYGNRDAPSIIINNELYIGTREQSHSHMVQNILYGMDRFDDCKFVSDDGFEWNRNNIEDDNCWYGHVIGDNIYWELWDRSRYELTKAIRELRKNKYNHYVFESYSYKNPTKIR